MYHNDPDGTTERIFAAGNSSTDIGFSEQSFYIKLYLSMAGELAVIPAQFGDRLRPLLYVDSFVTKKATCGCGTCAGDSATFASLMTGADMKTYIAYSHDLPEGRPPRHLLVATEPFWNQKDVRTDEIYEQVEPTVRIAQAFPNGITPAQQTEMSGAICKALKARISNYGCKQ